MRPLGLGHLSLSRRQTAAIGPWLSPLSLSAATIAEGAAAGTAVGTILGGTSGSTITLHAQSDADWFAKDGSVIEAGTEETDYETEAAPTVTLREALTGAGNTPRDTVIVIEVTNVLEVTLGALTLDNDTCGDDDPQGTLVGAIVGASSGSTITLHAQSVANAFQKDGNDIEVGSAAPLSEGTPTITLRETHVDGSNSPRDSVIPITVEAPAANIVVGNGEFANSTGWTLLNGQEGGGAPTISGGTLNFSTATAFNDPQALCTATETIVAGDYNISGTCTSFTRGSVSVLVGGSFAATHITAAGPFSFNVTSAASDQIIALVADAAETGIALSIDDLVITPI